MFLIVFSGLKDEMLEESENLPDPNILATDTDARDYIRFFEQHPDMEYLSESIYPNTLSVALRIPVRSALADLNAQPLVGFVSRNYPFVFCQ